MEISFFVPCFNEQGNIVPTIETIQQAVAGRNLFYEILVYDDASTDRSVEEIQTYLKGHPNSSVVFVANQFNKGPGANYVRGAAMARGEHYMMVCGDNDTPLKTLNFMLDQMGKADIIIPYIANIEERPLGRRLFSKAFVTLVGIISGANLKYYNGIVLHRTSTVKKFPPVSNGFAYQAEILCQAVASGLSYLEVPLYTVPQTSFLNTSAFRFRNVLSVLKALWRILLDPRCHRRRS